jgi:hypothetical protein
MRTKLFVRDLLIITGKGTNFDTVGPADAAMISHRLYLEQDTLLSEMCVTEVDG